MSKELKCRALLDIRAGSSYASSAPLECLQKRPTNQVIELHKLKISNVDVSFHLKTEVTKVNRTQLLFLGKYKEKIARLSDLQGIIMDDTDEKAELLIHPILGASEYARVKVNSMSRIGKPGKPIAELTHFGWTMMSPGKEVDLTNMFLTQASSCDYKNLYRLDVLGLEDMNVADQGIVYKEFKEQLKRIPEGWYEVGLP